MFCILDGVFLKPLFSRRALVFQHIVTLLLLADFCKGQSQEVGPSQTVVALVGDDVILPCHLEPAEDVVSKSVEWGRPDLEPRFVHVWHEGQSLLDNQNPLFKGRTSMSMDKLSYGDLSLTLSAVKHSDNGGYRCYFPLKDKQSIIELVVGSSSSPVVHGVDQNTEGVTLQCQSAGWYPQPEVLWLDGDRNLVSAGPTEAATGPDGLYTVSSRVTVKKSSNFICRVEQEKTKEAGETQIHISGRFFETSSADSARLGIVVVILVGLIFTVAFALWKLKQNHSTEAKLYEDRAAEREEEKLMAEKQKLEDLEEEQSTLVKELKKNEEDEKNLEQMVQKLKERNEEVHKQVDQLKQQEEDMEKVTENIERSFQSAEKMGESDKTQGFLKMKNIALEAKKHLLRGKEEYGTLEIKTHEFQTITEALVKTLTERKGAVENNKTDIREQLQKIKRKLSEQRLKIRTT